MKDSRKSSSVSRLPEANLHQVKKAKDGPSTVGFKSMLSCSSAAKLRNRLSWYVALNPKPSEIKSSHIPVIKWKCPPEIAPNNRWRVAGGEESQEAETQRRRVSEIQEVVCPHPGAIPPGPCSPPRMEGGCSDDSRTPVIPIDPIEDEADEMTFDTSATTNTLVNQTLPGNPPSSQCVHSGPQDQTFDGRSVPYTSHGSERNYLAIAAAAAATVAAAMDRKEQIDTELLIKLFSDPEMVETLIAGNVSSVMSENGTPPLPEPNAPLPIPSSSPPVVNKAAPACTAQMVSDSPDPRSRVETEMVKKLIGGPLPENRTSPAAVQNTPEPFPSTTPVSVVDKAASGYGETWNRATSRVLPSSEIKREVDVSASKPDGFNAGSGPMRASKPELSRFSTGEVGQAARSHIHLNSGIQQVRTSMCTILSPDEETMDGVVNRYLTLDTAGITTVAHLDSLDGVVNKYLMPDIAGASLHPSSTGNMEARKMIHKYGAPNPGAPLMSSSSRSLIMEERRERIDRYGVDHGWGKPCTRPSRPLLPPSPARNLDALPNASASNFVPPGNLSYPAPLNYHKSLINQHGERHETGEQRLLKNGQYGNYMQGAHSNPSTSIVTNPNPRKLCAYFGSPKGMSERLQLPVPP